MRAARRLLLATCLALPSAARADEVTDQLDQARRYYQDGAVGELEFVVQALRGQVGQQLLETFPPAPAGWTVEKGDEQAAVPFAAAGTMLSRTYRAPGGDG